MIKDKYLINLKIYHLAPRQGHFIKMLQVASLQITIKQLLDHLDSSKDIQLSQNIRVYCGEDLIYQDTKLSEVLRIYRRIQMVIRYENTYNVQMSGTIPITNTHKELQQMYNEVQRNWPSQYESQEVGFRKPSQYSVNSINSGGNIINSGDEFKVRITLRDQKYNDFQISCNKEDSFNDILPRIKGLCAKYWSHYKDNQKVEKMNVFLDGNVFTKKDKSFEQLGKTRQIEFLIERQYMGGCSIGKVLWGI